MSSIIQIVPKLNTGGLQKVCVGLSNSLSVGNQVTVISLSDVDSSDSLVGELSPNINFYSLNKNGSKIDFLLFFQLQRIGKRTLPNPYFLWS